VETWKDIKGFEGIYQISNMGRVKSFKADLNGRILSIKNSKGDYLNIVLCHGNTGKTKRQAGGYIWRFKLAAERRMAVGY